MKKLDYEYNFSKQFPGVLNSKVRYTKANKIRSVIGDYCKKKRRDSKKLTLLDVGCSGGYVIKTLSPLFKNLIGIDIDTQALKFARIHSNAKKARFIKGDGLNIPFTQKSFDVVICNHIYEHVPDARRLFSEIERVLKPGGFCLLAAGNKLTLKEGHYKLYFLSWLPKPLAHLYLKITKKGNFYYENHLTLWQLKSLLKNFVITDYTIPIIKNPKKFDAEDLIKENSIVKKLPVSLLKVLYWLIPTYILILSKKYVKEKGD